MDIIDERQLNVASSLPEVAQQRSPAVGTSGQLIAEQLQKLAIDSADLADFLLKLCQYSASEVAARTGTEIDCLVTLQSRENALIMTGDGPRGKLLNEFQERLNEGPCLAALEGKRTILIRDVPRDERWPVVSYEAAALGVQSVLAVPLVLDEGATASISFFAATPDAFDDDTVASVEQYVIQTKTVVRIAVRAAVSEQAADKLQDAMKARTIIDVAVGVVMGRQQCTAEAAQEFLQRASSARNQTVRAFAQALLIELTDTPISTHFNT